MPDLDTPVRPHRESVLDDLTDPKDAANAEHLRATDWLAFRRLLDALWHRRKAKAAVEACTPHRILDLVRRDAGASPEADGMGSGSGEGGRSSDTTSSTERAGVALAVHGRKADPTGVILSHALAELAEFGGHGQKVSEIMGLVDSLRSVKASNALSGEGDCSVCDVHVTGVGTDRRRSGLCPKHYAKWNRAHTSDPSLTLGDWQRAERGRWADEKTAEAAVVHEHEQQAS